MPPSRAFISYAHADLKFADMVKKVLASHGLSVWMDRDRLVGGNRWRNELREAIEQCDVFLLIMTPRALASAEVKKEYEAALSQGKRVIPLVWKRIRRAPEALQPLHWHDCSQRRGMRGLLDLIYTLYTQGIVAPFKSGAFDADMALARAIRGDFPPSWVVRPVDPLLYRRPYVLLRVTLILALAATIWIALIAAAAPLDDAVLCLGGILLLARTSILFTLAVGRLCA